MMEYFETEEEKGDDIRRLGTMFIQDTGYHYLARDKGGEAVGVLYVPEFPHDIIIGVRVVGRNQCGFELLSQAEAETHQEFGIPTLPYKDRKEVTINTVSGDEIMSYQLNYAVPGEDYDPNSDEAKTVELPLKALSLKGKLFNNTK